MMKRLRRFASLEGEERIRDGFLATIKYHAHNEAPMPYMVYTALLYTAYPYAL